jgi:hypothetical protein
VVDLQSRRHRRVLEMEISEDFRSLVFLFLISPWLDRMRDLIRPTRQVDRDCGTAEVDPFDL